MSRWKQVLRCADCSHRAWREVETLPFHPEPVLAALLKAARCGQCGSRNITGRQYDIGWRWLDQTLPGGMRGDLMDFRTCHARDAEVREALAAYKARTGEDWQHPRDPEYGGG